MSVVKESFGSVAAVAVLIRSKSGYFSGQKFVGAAAVQSSEVCDSASIVVDQTNLATFPLLGGFGQISLVQDIIS